LICEFRRFSHESTKVSACGRYRFFSPAREQLNAILSMDPDPNYLPELKEAQAQARRLLNSAGAQQSK